MRDPPLGGIQSLVQTLTGIRIKIGGIRSRRPVCYFSLVSKDTCVRLHIICPIRMRTDAPVSASVLGTIAVPETLPNCWSVAGLAASVIIPVLPSRHHGSYMPSLKYLPTSYPRVVSMAGCGSIRLYATTSNLCNCLATPLGIPLVTEGLTVHKAC
jgi:hypothetical protein